MKDKDIYDYLYQQAEYEKAEELKEEEPALGFGFVNIPRAVNHPGSGRPRFMAGTAEQYRKSRPLNLERYHWIKEHEDEPNYGEEDLERQNPNKFESEGDQAEAENLDEIEPEAENINELESGAD